MLTVYGRHNSSNSAKVFWLLDELGERYELVPTGTGFGATDTAAFLAMNPFGKVPVVRDGDTIVWESNAVLRYLAGRAPNALWPEDAAGRSGGDRWMDWSAISLTPPLTRLRKARAAGKAETEADLAAVIRGVQVLDHALAGQPYLAGETLSVADIALSPSVCRWFRLPESAMPLPALAAYRDRLETNDGYRRHIRDALA
ncbi:glutathione S-transferase family protein [Frigidibacter oleivorans]|uniref:glutathione S-transferase family protein n=1 Tax=Frigidibacter oleivorans TaxID=2487129 RepID=UPI000F8C5E28|nr:glutathione S-transferase family protein [Frigidibacter oleivorans]